jgi:hypothetical protein
MKNFKIVVAVSTPSLPGLLSDILAQHTLFFASDLDHALSLMEVRQDADLILCGLHFDNGKMYELLAAAKSSKAAANTPFVCLQFFGSILPYGAFNSMRAAFEILGGDLFIQVAKWRIDYGDEEAFRKFNDVILKVVADPRRKDLTDIALGNFS